MAGISEYERLQIDSLLNRRFRPVSPGTGLILIPETAQARELVEIAIQPALQSNAIAMPTLHCVFDSDAALNEICYRFQTSEVIVADVSGLSSHLMYVLGLSHGMGRSPLLVCDDPDQLPFNFQALRCLEFSRTQQGLYDLRDHLTRAIRVFLAAARATGGPETST